MLDVERIQAEDVDVLRLDGDIDEDGAKELRIALTSCLRDNVSNVVLNMTEVKFISYMGVGILVERLRQFRSEGGDLKLVGLNLYTKRLFRMVSVNKLFDIYDQEDQALQQYQQAA